MKILKFLLIIFFFNPHAQTKELPRIDTKFYLGVYNSFDKLSATAHSIYHPEYSGYNPYYTETDSNKENLGFFLGYDFKFDNFLVGLESNFQEDIGTDKSIAGINGEVTYEKMIEAKLKLGYQINDFSFFSYIGRGNFATAWTAYHNDPDNVNNYITRGIGVDYNFFKNYFLGLNLDETTLDVYYAFHGYVEEIHKRSVRLRFGYLF